jgi:hypothetical protein
VISGLLDSVLFQYTDVNSVFLMGSVLVTISAYMFYSVTSSSSSSSAGSGSSGQAGVPITASMTPNKDKDHHHHLHPLLPMTIVSPLHQQQHKQ